MSTPANALGASARLAQCRLDSWGVRDGLPSRDINAIVQTPDGYMWIGTGGGLIRFDGTSFDTFTTKNTPGLKSNEITALYVSRSGQLWVGTQWGGFGTLDGGEFHRIDTDIKSWNTVYCFHEAADGSMWVGGNGNDRLFHVDHGRVVMAEHMIDAVEGLGELPNGEILCLTWTNGLWRLLPNGKNVAYLRDGLSTPMFGMVQTGASSYWICSKTSGLFRFDHGKLSNSTTSNGISGNAVHALYVDRAGTTWIGTNNGIDRWDGKAFSHFGKTDGLSDSEVRAICEDKEGNLWVAAGTELDRFAATKLSPYTMSQGAAVASVFDHNGIAPARSGGVWVSTNLGLWRITTTTTRHVALPSPLKGNADSIIAGPDGLIWLIWEEGPDKNTVACIPETSLEHGSSEGLSLFNLGKGLGILSGVGIPGKLVGFAQDMLHVVNRDGSETVGPYKTGFVFASQRDASGRFWIGCESGLYRVWRGKYDVMDDGLPPGTHVLGVDTGDSRNPLSDGELWLATDHGLAHFVKGHSTLYGLAAGLPDTNVYQVMVQGDSVWAGSNAGIFRVKRTDLAGYDAGRIGTVPVEIFAAADGLRSFPVYYADCRTADGKLWFVGPKGVTMVDPAQIQVNTVRPPVVIEQANVDGKPIAAGVDNRLAPGSGDLQVQFAALTYSAPEQVVFRYRLEGFDKSWRTASGHSRGAASYTNLPPGRYRFVVAAGNNDGVWNNAGANFSIEIAPHYYQTAWFAALCVLGLAALIAYVFHLRARQITAHNRHLERLVAERTGELRDANGQLSEAHEELCMQNEELQSVQEELQAQNEELVESRALLADQNERLASLATTDGLTGIKNRRTFQEKLEEDFKYSVRYDAPLALILLDVDKFKSYNDTFGHPAGDAVLKEVAAILSQCARETDFVARYGGEEFVVILPQTDPADAVDVAERLRAGIEAGDWIERPVTASFGVANIGDGASTPADLISQADEALYMSKENGRNRVTRYVVTRQARAVNQ